MTSEPEFNPYQTSDLGNNDRALPPARRGPRYLQVWWTIAFIVNLPMPIIMGFSVAESDRSRIGMPIGVAIVYLVGFSLCNRNPILMRNLISGSVITAVSQFVPIAHAVVGGLSNAISMFITESLLTGVPWVMKYLDVIQIALTTVLTGAGLGLLSLLIGAFVTLMFGEASDA